MAGPSDRSFTGSFCNAALRIESPQTQTGIGFRTAFATRAMKIGRGLDARARRVRCAGGGDWLAGVIGASCPRGKGQTVLGSGVAPSCRPTSKRLSAVLARCRHRIARAPGTADLHAGITHSPRTAGASGRITRDAIGIRTTRPHGRVVDLAQRALTAPAQPTATTSDHFGAAHRKRQRNHLRGTKPHRSPASDIQARFLRKATWRRNERRAFKGPKRLLPPGPKRHHCLDTRSRGPRSRSAG